MAEITRSDVPERLTEENDAVGEQSDSGLQSEPDDSSHGIECSLNPAEVRIRTNHITVEEIVSRIWNGKIYWDSDIQRSFAWQQEDQSRFIESLLLRIPMPAIFAAADKSSNCIMVDGVQRLSPIYNFVTGEFPLKRLEYFGRFNGQWFNDLPRPMQRRIDETQITAHIVEAGTPERVRLNIFRRINFRRFDAKERRSSRTNMRF